MQFIIAERAEIGATHSGRCSARSAALRAPPVRREVGDPASQQQHRDRSLRPSLSAISRKVRASPESATIRCLRRPALWQEGLGEAGPGQLGRLRGPIGRCRRGDRGFLGIGDGRSNSLANGSLPKRSDSAFQPATWPGTVTVLAQVPGVRRGRQSIPASMPLALLPAAGVQASQPPFVPPARTYRRRFFPVSSGLDRKSIHDSGGDGALSHGVAAGQQHMRSPAWAASGWLVAGHDQRPAPAFSGKRTEG